MGWPTNCTAAFKGFGHHRPLVPPSSRHSASRQMIRHHRCKSGRASLPPQTNHPHHHCRTEIAKLDNHEDHGKEEDRRQDHKSNPQENLSATEEGAGTRKVIKTTSPKTEGRNADAGRTCSSHNRVDHFWGVHRRRARGREPRRQPSRRRRSTMSEVPCPSFPVRGCV